MVDVAVVGAGLAGLTAAIQLHRGGYRVVVVEKSRGVGGRVNTRRLSGTCVDRGARYIEAQGRLLAPWVDAMHRRGVVRPWSETGYVWKSGAGIVPVSVYHPRYVAPDGINAIAKWIGADSEIWRARRAVRIIRHYL